MCMFCRSLFVLLYLFFWPLWCLFFFDIRILFTYLVYSSSASWTTTVRFFKKKYIVFISGTMLLKFSFTSAKRFEVFLYDLLILWFKILKPSWFKHNSYIERDKRTYKTKDRVTRTPLKPEGELGYKSWMKLCIIYVHLAVLRVTKTKYIMHKDQDYK